MQGKYRISVLLISLVRNSPTLELRWDAWQLTECTKRMLIIFVVHNEEILFLDCLILKRNVLRPFETYVGNYLPVGVVHHSCEFHRLPIWNRVSFHILESSGKARLLWKSITINQSLNIDNMRTKPDINCTNTVPNPSSLLSYNISSYFFLTFMGLCFGFMYSSLTNKMQRYTILFITINALHVSGGSSAHHQELKTVYTAWCICRAFTASYRLLTQVWSPDDGRRNRLKHVEHL